MKLAILLGPPRLHAFKEIINSREVAIVLMGNMVRNDPRCLEAEQLCKKQGIPFQIVKKNTEIEILKKYQYDVIVSIGYAYIIKSDVIKSAKHCINCHPTLLPKYKGNGTGIGRYEKVQQKQESLSIISMRA